mmetsp:Transcript_15272/g.18167  ORF Transcript_15272/g.18167 Transcript_15272/m.18167 type:complete len:88 (+) Transcript_15272:119-382(+)
MPPAKKLPSNIAKRFKKKRQRDGDDEAYWEEVAAKNDLKKRENHLDKNPDAEEVIIKEPDDTRDEPDQKERVGTKKKNQKKKKKKKS